MLNLLIKPASSLCNLQCRYCFYHDLASKRSRKSYGLMTLSTLENIVRKAFEYEHSEITFAFQGGEPTLAGLPFFRGFSELLKKYDRGGVKINLALQTNGINLTREWAGYLRKEHFLVGLSLDGDAGTHNAYRVDNKGAGSFSGVLAAADMLAKENVDFNILTVVNTATVRHADSIYSFYKRRGFDYAQYIPCLPQYGAEDRKSEYMPSEEKYGRFLCTLYDRWITDYLKHDGVHIRQFENYVDMLTGRRPESCGMSGICSLQNVIESNGNVYPCDFYASDEFFCGNLNENSFAEISGRRKALGFIERSAAFPEKCRACEFGFLCRDGCAKYRASSGVNVYCGAYRMFFAHALPSLRSIASAILNGSQPGGFACDVKCKHC